MGVFSRERKPEKKEKKKKKKSKKRKKFMAKWSKGRLASCSVKEHSFFSEICCF